METSRKIASACFIGGTTFCMVALLFAPLYWWFGLLAGTAVGGAAGYLSFDFSEVRAAIPIAWRTARRALPGLGFNVTLGVTLIVLASIAFVMESASATVVVMRDTSLRVRLWFSEPKPFAHPAMALAIVPACWTFWSIGGPLLTKNGDNVIGGVIIYMWLPLLVMVYFELMFILLGVFAFIGARVDEKCFWYPFERRRRSTGEMIEVMEKLEAKGLHGVPLTYRNVGRWVAKGLSISLRFALWTWWTQAFVLGFTVAFAAVRLVIQFLYELGMFVYSQERVLCAVYGVAGGLASCLYFGPAATSVSERAVLILFGGLLGAAFGVANWEVISKGLLRVHEKSASA